MRRLLGPAWHPDMVATFRDICAGAHRRHGIAGYVMAAFAESTNLLVTAVRARLGRRALITGGHPPPTPRKAGSPVRAVIDDVMSGWRRMVRQPRAALGVIALLTLAVGVASAMFTVVDAFLVRTAPFRDPGSLARISIAGTGGTRTELAAARAWRDSGVFESVIPAIMNATVEFDGPTGPAFQTGARVTPGTFAQLGVAPLLGREFVQGEGLEGNEDYILLSEEVWRARFGADPAIVGKPIIVSKQPRIVVGIMPSGLRFPLRGGIWLPFDLDRPSTDAARNQSLIFVRRQPGMSAAEADRLATEVVQKQLAGTGTVTSRAAGSTLDDYSRASIVSLSIGVALVFVLLCANVSNLILARTAARRQEFGVCSALGASRFRMMRQVLFENAALGVVASVLGLALAYGLIALANTTLPEDILWRTLNPLDVDIRAVAATSVIGVLAVMLAGLPAAWLGTRVGVNESIGASRGGTDSPGGRRLTRGLLVVEVAMAVAVLASAGLHVRSFVNLVNADRGLDTDRVLVATATLPTGATGASGAVLASDAEARVAALPGVERVTRTPHVPPDHGSLFFGLQFQTDIPESPTVTSTLLRSYDVPAGFFETFGIRIVDGRGFDATDDEHTLVISEQLAQQLYGDQSAAGRTLTLWKRPYRVVGVATEIRNSITEPREDHPEFYMRWSAPVGTVATREVRIGIRCAQPCASHESIRQAISSVGAGVEVTALRELSDDFLEQLARPKMAAVVAAAFSGLALLATAAGLYGVLAYAVSRRRREFGIRAALGAHPSQLRRLVLRDGVVVTSIGLIVGLGAGWGLARWLESVRYGVTFLDPLTWGTVTLTVLVVAVVASWIPARTAMRVDPAEMLRES
jgi:putative ABC transport system permease protein